MNARTRATCLISQRFSAQTCNHGEVRTMSAYAIAQIMINDSEKFQDYLTGFMPIFERYDGELLVTSKRSLEVVEGEWEYPAWSL